MRLLTILSFAGMLVFQPVWAEETEATQRELAEQLLVLMAVDEQIEQSFAMMKQVQAQQMRQMGIADEEIEDGVTMFDKVMDFLSQELSWESLKDEFADLYADLFTKEELRGLIEFYESPVGQAFTKKTPELMRRTMMISHQRTMEVMPKLERMLRE